ncbi:hypothetical protein BGX29_004735 [Mortierella sp. GBA35]|nr:hypothetical protein BGX29_004735 [Mortierella sp. GBA35]
MAEEIKQKVCNKIARRYGPRDRSSSLEQDAIESFKSRYQGQSLATTVVEMLKDKDAISRKAARCLIPRYTMAKPQSTSSSQPNTKATTKTTSVFSRIAVAAKRATNSPRSTEDRSITNGIAAVLLESGKLPVVLGEPHHANPPQGARRSAINHGTTISSRPSNPKSRTPSTPTTLSSSAAPKENAVPSISKVKQLRTDIFPKNLPKPKSQTSWPKVGGRIESMPQLALCSTLLPKELSVDVDSSDASDLLEDDADKKPLRGVQLDWAKAMEEPMIQDRIRWLARETVRKFSNDATKDSNDIAEVVLLGPVLDRDYYRILLIQTTNKFESSLLLDTTSLQGLVQLVQCASPGYLEADDLRRILGIVRTRLLNTLQQSTDYVYHLTLAVSRILDVMADNKVEGLDRVKEHEALSAVLSGLKGSSDPFLLYQASYAFQALQYVPHDETTTQAVLRHSAGVAESMIKLSALLKLDVSEFFNGLKGLTEVAGNLYQGAKSGYEAVSSLIESGRGVFDSLKDAFGSGYRRQWYLAIRQADSFIRNGRLAELNRLICEAPCRKDPFFQWGICQLLGELAADSNWDIDSRKQAVDFLLALHKNDTDWGQDASVRTWTLTLLEQVSIFPIDSSASIRDVSRQDHTVKDYALTLLKGLTKDVADGPACRSPYSLRSRLPLPKSSRLLKLVQDIPYVEYDLHELKSRRLEKYGQDVYIPPLAKANLKASDDDAFPLMEYVEGFLASDRQVLLILGDSGSGKSTFNRHLERELWKTYKPSQESDPIPLYINLAAINQPEQDFIAKQLAVHNISQLKIQELKEHRRFILICDGYDESGSKLNLYSRNQLNQGKGHWRAKMVITCRTSHLGDDYQRKFKPLSDDYYNNRNSMNYFQEAVITPFTDDQVKHYIDQYALTERLGRPKWTAEEYNNTLNKIPSLKDLVKNPFLLTLALDAMPNLVGNEKDLSRIKVNRLVLYDKVVDAWIDLAGDRFGGGHGLSEAEREAFDALCDDNFNLTVIQYLKDLAKAVFKEQQGNPCIKYVERTDSATWKAKFFGRTPETTVLRLSSPLIRSGIQHSFIHLSVLDYFFARVVYDPEESVVDHASLNNLPLAQTNISSYPSILLFLAERVQQESEETQFKQQLLDIIEASKTDIGVTQAAANAITILVKAGVQFNGADLKGVRFEGADLSGGQFDSAQFQGAVLNDVKLASSWIRQANFSNAHMTGAQFGELPFLKPDVSPLTCAYTPDGKTFVAGLESGDIEVFDTATWTRIHTHSGVPGYVISLTFSPTGDRIVASYWQQPVRVWDAVTGAVRFDLDTTSESARSVAVSPTGGQVASAHNDNTVRLWSLETGALLFILTGHTERVESVAFSPDGLQLASASSDETVRLWRTQDGEPGLVLKSELGKAHSVAYSPDGQRIASGHSFGRVGGAVQLWNAGTGEPGLVLHGHSSSVASVRFTSDSQWIVSGSYDNTVRLWSSQTGTLASIFKGHSKRIFRAVFSPDDLQIASCSWDGTVRLWKVNTTSTRLVLQDYTGSIASIAYSPDGRHIISRRQDKTLHRMDARTGESHPHIRLDNRSFKFMEYSSTGRQIATVSLGDDDRIRLWDSPTGKAGAILSGHDDTDSINQIVYSPCGRWLASISYDETLRLWDTLTAEPGLVINIYGSCVRFSPSGHQIALGGVEKRFTGIGLFDAKTGERVATLRGHTDIVTSVSYSPDGLQVLSSSYDKILRIWDARTNEPIAVLEGHSYKVESAVFSPCGKWIVSGSRDMTARLWGISSGSSASEQNSSSWTCLSVVQPFFNDVYQVIWNPKHAMEFVTASGDGSVSVWKVVVVKESKEDGVKGDVRVELLWSSYCDRFVALGANTKDAIGLSPFNQELLKQTATVKEWNGDMRLTTLVQHLGSKDRFMPLAYENVYEGYEMKEKYFK